MYVVGERDITETEEGYVVNLDAGSYNQTPIIMGMKKRKYVGANTVASTVTIEAQTVVVFEITSGGLPVENVVMPLGKPFTFPIFRLTEQSGCLSLSSTTIIPSSETSFSSPLTSCSEGTASLTSCVIRNIALLNTPLLVKGGVGKMKLKGVILKNVVREVGDGGGIVVSLGEGGRNSKTPPDE
jgi:hypothetical protein